MIYPKINGMEGSIIAVKPGRDRSVLTCASKTGQKTFVVPRKNINFVTHLFYKTRHSWSTTCKYSQDMEALGDDIVYEITCWMLPEELLAFGQTNKRFHNITDDEHLWYVHMIVD